MKITKNSGVRHQMVRHRHVKLSNKVDETISNTDPRCRGIIKC